MAKPLYEHDCDRCQFLGTFENDMKYDLYRCKTQSGEFTYLARYGHYGPMYLSSRNHNLISHHPELEEAKRRSEELDDANGTDSEEAS